MSSITASLRLEDSVLAKVEKLASMRNVKRGTVLRECVEKHIDQELETLEKIQKARQALDEMKSTGRVLTMDDGVFYFNKEFKPE